MTGLDALIAKARSAPRPHIDVDVTLDDDASVRLAALERELAEHDADARQGDERPGQIRAEMDQVRAEAADAVIVLRFRRLDPSAWADITATNPMRYESVTDRLYGYNVHEAARLAAPTCGVRVVRGPDGADVEETVTPEQWDGLLELMAGRDFTRVADAIFNLNDWGPQQRLDAARKASRAGTGVTSA